MRGSIFPFEVLHNLNGEAHSYYHDIESILYVLCWLCTLHCGPRRSKRDIDFKTLHVALWNDTSEMTLEFIAALKARIVSNSALFEVKILDEVDDYFIPLLGFLEEIRDNLFPCVRYSEIVPDSEARDAGERMKTLEIRPEPLGRSPGNFFADLLSACDACIEAVRILPSICPSVEARLPTPRLEVDLDPSATVLSDILPSRAAEGNLPEPNVKSELEPKKQIRPMREAEAIRRNPLCNVRHPAAKGPLPRYNLRGHNKENVQTSSAPQLHNAFQKLKIT